MSRNETKKAAIFILDSLFERVFPGEGFGIRIEFNSSHTYIIVDLECRDLMGRVKSYSKIIDVDSWHLFNGGDEMRDRIFVGSIFDEFRAE